MSLRLRHTVTSHGVVDEVTSWLLSDECRRAENTTRRDDTDNDVVYGEDDNHANTSVYDKVANTLSQQFLAALRRSSRTSTPDQKSSMTANNNRASTPSRRSWERFLAEMVSNLSSAAKRGRRITPRARFTPTTSTTVTQHSRSLATSKKAEPSTSATSVKSTPSSNVEQVRRQRQQLSRLRPHRHGHLRESRSSSARHAPRTPLNLKSPPAVRLHRLEVSTDKPVSRSGKTTARLPPLTTPPVYVRHRQVPVTPSVEHAHHQHQHHQHTDVRHQHVIKTPSVGWTRHNSTPNVTGDMWSSPANQLSAASLFRTLGLWTGNDVNVTSSSTTVADMMQYVLEKVIRLFSAGICYLLNNRITTSADFYFKSRR